MCVQNFLYFHISHLKRRSEQISELGCEEKGTFFISEKSFFKGWRKLLLLRCSGSASLINRSDAFDQVGTSVWTAPHTSPPPEVEQRELTKRSLSVLVPLLLLPLCPLLHRDWRELLGKTVSPVALSSGSCLWCCYQSICHATCCSCRHRRHQWRLIFPNDSSSLLVILSVRLASLRCQRFPVMSMWGLC